MGFLLIFAPSAGGPAPLGGFPELPKNGKYPLGGFSEVPKDIKYTFFN